MVNACDIDTADQCCGVIPCKLCLELETYDGIEYGSADFTAASWTGTVGGHAFVSYWERSSGDVCEFIVYFGGYEVYRASCYDGASCRDPAGEASVTVNGESGTLRWSVYEPRELALIDDPDTGCRDFFCGDCRCSCECLCVTITEYGGNVYIAELCDTAYDCDPPVWGGSVGYYDLSIALGRDQYGECIITVTIDGDEQAPVAAPGCGSMAATILLANGDLIEVRCKECSCGEVIEETCCGPNRCLPHQECENPLPYSLRINVAGTYSGAFGGSTCTCLLLDSTLTFYENGADNPDTGLPNVWTGTFTVCGKTFRYSLGCVDGTLGWRLSFFQNNLAGSATPTDCLASSVMHPDGVLMEKATCSPLVLDGVMNTSGIGCCEPAHLVGLATLDITIWEE